MGSSIGFYCGKADNAELTEFARSVGLHVVPPRLDRESAGEPEEAGPFCYLSTLPREELHPYGQPPVLIADVKDPLLLFMRGFYKEPYLVLGQIHWNNDVAALASITRPYFQKLTRWIRQNWRKPDRWDFYCEPEASTLLARGAQTVNSLPSIPIKTIIGE